MDEHERKTEQWALRDKQLTDIEQWLAEASKMIDGSKREVQRSRDLLRERRDQDVRDDKAAADARTR